MREDGFYVALLRGINPVNPKMRGKKLREFFEGLGFTKVKTVISSGNVIFNSPSREIKALEDKIEGAIPNKLGFSSTTIIRTKEEIQKLVENNPFESLHGTANISLYVTFLKNPSKASIYSGLGYKIVKTSEREICYIVELSNTQTPDVMLKMEKTYGKEITTRSWKTVLRILEKL